MMKAFAIFLILASSAYAEMPGIWLDEPVISLRIVKGEDAKEGEFPYMVSLRRKQDSSHLCGGSILTSNWALTAAHCCAEAKGNTHFINAGSIFLNRGGTNHSIEKIIIHAGYDPNFYWLNDVCLIRVSTPFRFTNEIKQITLPPQSWRVDPGDKLTASGWGYNNLSQGKLEFPNRLQKATTFTALSNEGCRNETGVPVTPGYICARGGVKGQGVCNGDSGSPLVKNGVQVGVTSWVFFPCGSGKPDFFSRVPNYINWIKKQLGSEAGQLQFTR